MEWLGLGLGIVGMAIGLVALAPDRFSSYTDLLFTLGVVGIGVGIAVSLWPLVRTILERRNLLIPFVYVWRIAMDLGVELNGEREQDEMRSHLWQRAREGAFKVYGELAVDSRELKRVPLEYLAQTEFQITTGYVLGHADNRQICTWANGRRGIQSTDSKEGTCYYNLHANKAVLEVLRAYADAQRTARKQKDVPTPSSGSI